MIEPVSTPCLPACLHTHSIDLHLVSWTLPASSRSIFASASAKSTRRYAFCVTIPLPATSNHPVRIYHVDKRLSPSYSLSFTAFAHRGMAFWSSSAHCGSILVLATASCSWINHGFGRVGRSRLADVSYGCTYPFLVRLDLLIMILIHFSLFLLLVSLVSLYLTIDFQ